MLKTGTWPGMLFALVGLSSTAAWADNCPELAGKTMCITATNSYGGSWSMNAQFGSFDPITADGTAAIGSNSGSYRFIGNSFTRIMIYDTTGETLIWNATVGKNAKKVNGTGQNAAGTSAFRYKAVKGACPTAP